MIELTGIARYRELILDFSKEYTTPAWKYKKRTGSLLALPTDKHFLTVFNGYMEIDQTLETLVIVETLMGRVPPKSQFIQKNEYLRFLVSSYFHEMYILEQRLSTYAKKLHRMYKKVGTAEADLIAKIDKSLGKLIKIRGEHVHESRYTDRTLAVLDSSALLSQLNPKFDFDFDYKVARTKWRNVVRQDRQNLYGFLNEYFDILFNLVERDGKVRLPRTGKGK